MVTKADVDSYARARPFKPFEIRMVDGQRWRFNRMEKSSSAAPSTKFKTSSALILPA